MKPSIRAFFGRRLVAIAAAPLVVSCVLVTAFDDVVEDSPSGESAGQGGSENNLGSTSGGGASKADGGDAGEPAPSAGSGGRTGASSDAGQAGDAVDGSSMDAGSVAGSDGGSCLDACTEGARRCISSRVEECRNATSGCTEWELDVTCELGCDGDQCETPPGCSTQCSLKSTRCANSGQVEECQADDTGCLNWEIIETCASREECSDGECRCVPSCAGKECGTDGCDGSCGSCGASEACEGGLCASQCADGCPSAGAKRCANNSVEECGHFDSDDCLEWGNQQNCNFGCSGGECVAGMGTAGAGGSAGAGTGNAPGDGGSAGATGAAAVFDADLGTGGGIDAGVDREAEVSFVRTLILSLIGVQALVTFFWWVLALHGTVQKRLKLRRRRRESRFARNFVGVRWVYALCTAMTLVGCALFVDLDDVAEDSTDAGAGSGGRVGRGSVDSAGEGGEPNSEAGNAGQQVSGGDTAASATGGTKGTSPPDDSSQADAGLDAGGTPDALESDAGDCAEGQSCCPPPGQECSLPDCGCPDGQVCSVLLDCEDTDGLIEGQVCGNLTCGPGLACVNGLCKSYCSQDSDCNVTEGVQVCSLVDFPDARIAATGICPTICDPARPQSPRGEFSDCPSGFACGKANDGIVDCFPRGGRGLEGYSCNGDNDLCAPGFFCEVNRDICMRYCLDDSDCSTGCRSVSDGLTLGDYEVGACDLPLPDLVISDSGVLIVQGNDAVSICLNMRPDGTTEDRGDFIEVTNIGYSAASDYRIAGGVIDSEGGFIGQSASTTSGDPHEPGATRNIDGEICFDVAYTRLEAQRQYTVVLFVDPDDEVDEVLEGNNIEEKGISFTLGSSD